MSNGIENNLQMHNSSNESIKLGHEPKQEMDQQKIEFSSGEVTYQAVSEQNSLAI